MTDVGLTEHMNTVEKRLKNWLAKQPPEDRIRALADLRPAIASLTEMEKTLRRDTLIELIDTNGLEAAAQSLNVAPQRLLRAINPNQ